MCHAHPSLIHTVYIQTYIYLYWHNSLVYVAKVCLSPFLPPTAPPCPPITGTRDPSRPLPFSLETAMMF